MPNFSFSKLIPGGNPTIILHEPALDAAALAALSARLMDPLHLGGEQVGALYCKAADEGAGLPRLQMMGGEFCVNASRAAAFLLARQGCLIRLAGSLPDCLASADACGAPAPGSVWSGQILVSGLDRPVSVLVAGDGNAQAQVAARVDCSAPNTTIDTLCQALRPGVTLVHMPGMVHALIDAARHPLPDFESNVWREASARLRRECGLGDAPASGIIWFRQEEHGFRIWPAVEVKATLSEHLESACGSASLAVALWRWQHTDAGPVTVLQPSGEALRVFPDLEPDAGPGRVWITGPVLLAAEGIVHI